MTTLEYIPLDLLKTFVHIANLEGDATTAARELGISQPTVSKRLSALRRLTSDPDRQPWLLLKGKRWRLTSEGQRVRGVVGNLVQQYEQMQQFVASQQSAKPLVSIACGQQAAQGIIRSAVSGYLANHPDCRFRISTPRGRARIEGVAGGQFDLALVTDSPAAIRRIARVGLYVETLFRDRFVLIANPAPKIAWGRQWNALSAAKPVTAAEVLEVPFVLPEPDAASRQQFDNWFHKSTGQLPNVVLETGGWQTILQFAMAGVGVGIVPESSLAALEPAQRRTLSDRRVDSSEWPAEAVRLIARKAHGTEHAELTPAATRFAEVIRSHATN